MFMNYKGHELKPIGNILGGWKVRVSTMSYEKDQLCFENYIYADFYRQAKEQHESCDIYEYNGEWYMPTNNCLCYVDKEKANKHLKRIEEYSKWYHRKGGKSMTIRDLIEQGVHIQGDTITIQTWNEATNFENKILGACYNNLTTDGIEQYLDCEITHIYQVNHQLVIEIKTKEGQV